MSSRMPDQSDGPQPECMFKLERLVWQEATSSSWHLY